MALLPARLAADAAACQLLEGSGLSLCDAVRQLFAAVHAQGVACAPFVPSGGAGAEIGTAAPAAAAPLTLPGILAKVEAAKGHQSIATRRARRGACHTLFSRNPGLSEVPLEHFTPEMVQAALDAAWSHSPTVWNGGRRQLHALFAYAIKRRLVRIENPVTCLEQRHVQEAEITALPPGDLQKLFAACRPATAAEIAAATGATEPAAHRAATEDLTYLRPYIAVCAFAGMRPTECTRLRWQDIDFEDAIISVRAANSKTGGQRHIEMHPTLRAWLLACRPADAEPGSLVTPAKKLHANLAALRHRAGFGGGIWQHDCLRHSYPHTTSRPATAKSPGYSSTWATVPRSCSIPGMSTWPEPPAIWQKNGGKSCRINHPGARGNATILQVVQNLAPLHLVSPSIKNSAPPGLPGRALSCTILATPASGK